MLLTRRDFLRLRLVGRAEPAPATPDTPIPGRFTLDLLRHLPDSVLRKMVPMARQGWTVTVQENGVSYRGEPGKEGFVPLLPAACAAVRKFDGSATVDQIGGDLDREMEWPPGQGYALVRDTFLSLADREVYHPSGPPAAE